MYLLQSHIHSAKEISHLTKELFHPMLKIVAILSERKNLNVGRHQRFFGPASWQAHRLELWANLQRDFDPHLWLHRLYISILLKVSLAEMSVAINVSRFKRIRRKWLDISVTALMSCEAVTRLWYTYIASRNHYSKQANLLRFILEEVEVRWIKERNRISSEKFPTRKKIRWRKVLKRSSVSLPLFEEHGFFVGVKNIVFNDVWAGSVPYGP